MSMNLFKQGNSMIQFPNSRVLVRTVYEAFFFSLTLFKLCFLIQCFFLSSFS